MLGCTAAECFSWNGGIFMWPISEPEDFLKDPVQDVSAATSEQLNKIV